MKLGSALGLATALALTLAAPVLANGPAGVPWATSEGTMTFVVQPDGAVVAQYESDGGRIFGRLRGQQLTGYWVERNSSVKCVTARDGSMYWGPIVWDFNADWTEFAGSWGHCDDPKPVGPWSGNRPPPGPVQWPLASGGNDHWYELVAPPGGMTWPAANGAASIRTHAGHSGYLVTITSAAENTFLVKTFGTRMDGFVWIGASDAAKEGAWRWVGGPEAGRQFSQGRKPAGYANWGGVEPNNDGDEDAAALNLGGSSAGTERGQWGDTKMTARFGAYIVEYGGGTAPVVAQRPVLRFVRQNGPRFESITGELAYAEQFFVEVHFAVAPDDSDHVVTLQAPRGEALSVAVHRTAEDRRLFRSGSLVLSPVP
jgi:hypothetical protein